MLQINIQIQVNSYINIRDYISYKQQNIFCLQFEFGMNMITFNERNEPMKTNSFLCLKKKKTNTRDLTKYFNRTKQTITQTYTQFFSFF